MYYSLRELSSFQVIGRLITPKSFIVKPFFSGIDTVFLPLKVAFFATSGFDMTYVLTLP